MATVGGPHALPDTPMTEAQAVEVALRRYRLIPGPAMGHGTNREAEARAAAIEAANADHRERAYRQDCASCRGFGIGMPIVGHVHDVMPEPEATAEPEAEAPAPIVPPVPVVVRRPSVDDLRTDWPDVPHTTAETLREATRVKRRRVL